MALRPRGAELRSHLLQYLRSAGGPVSGGELARGLGVSRTAVWKQVRALRRLGYRIEGSPGSGYRLLEGTDLPWPEEVVPRLPTRILGRPYHFFRELDSTNLELRRLALEGAPEGTTVVADFQRQGRGRRGRSWVAPPGTALHVSVLLRPERPPAEVGRLTLLTALATRHAIEHATGLKPGIKWPNDLLLDGRKCCGILVETAVQQDQVEFAVVGVGINVNQMEDDFPPELRTAATSLRQALGGPVCRVELLLVLLAALEEVYAAWRAGRDRPLLDAWRAACVHLGQRVRVTGAGGEWTGVALDVEDDGSLLLLPDGRREPVRVLAGDVSLRPAEPAGRAGGA